MSFSYYVDTSSQQLPVVSGQCSSSKIFEFWNGTRTSQDVNFKYRIFSLKNEIYDSERKNIMIYFITICLKELLSFINIINENARMRTVTTPFCPTSTREDS